MKKRITLQFTILAFAIAYAVWAICIVSGQFGITLTNDMWLYIPYLLGALAPSIASYVVLKKNNKVTGFKEWLKNVFNFRTHIVHYLLIILVLAIYFIPRIFIAGLKEMYPFYMFFLMLPAMVMGGGLEESGWRYILQPELDKKYGFIFSSIFVAVIWSVWHLPLFFIPAVAQYGANFGLFALQILGSSFVMGAIRKISGRVSLCILAHSMANAGLSTFIVNETFLGNAIPTGLVITVSTVAVYIHNQKRRAKERTWEGKEGMPKSPCC